MSRQIRITVTNQIDELLSKVAKKLGKKKSQLVRELMEQKMYDLNLIQKHFEDLK
jgi:predicted DNA-binding protein